MSSIDSTAAQKSGNLFLGLWRGDVALARTYWLHGTLGGFALSLISPVIIYFIFAQSRHLGLNGLRFFTGCWCLFCIAWSIFIGVATWRSATNYARTKPKRRYNAIAAKVSILVSGISALIIGVQLVEGSSRNSLSEQYFHYEFQIDQRASLAGLNAGLPRKIDKITYLDRIDLQNYTFYYYYRITNVVVFRDAFKERMSQKLSADVCTKTAFRDLLMRNYALDFIYSDAISTNFVSFAFRRSDCSISD